MTMKAFTTAIAEDGDTLTSPWRRPQRVVRAGPELLTAVGALTRALLQTRVGIATGLVVVGDLIG
jgi:class 3 adenylate cyclase